VRFERLCQFLTECDVPARFSLKALFTTHFFGKPPDVAGGARVDRTQRGAGSGMNLRRLMSSM